MPLQRIPQEGGSRSGGPGAPGNAPIASRALVWLMVAHGCLALAAAPFLLYVLIAIIAGRAFVTLILFTALLLVLTPVLCWRTASALKARSPQAFTRGLAAVALGIVHSVYLIVFDPISTFGEFVWAMPTLGQSTWQQVAPLLLAAFEALLLGLPATRRWIGVATGPLSAGPYRKARE